MANGKKPSPSVEAILQQASKEILKEQSACFSVGDGEWKEPTTYSSAYNINELSEFINFDLLVEDEDNLASSGHLTNDSEAQDLMGNGQVLKIMLDNGIGEVVPENSVVMVHYIAYLLNSHEPFDVTYLQGRRPKRFTLGDGELLQGLEIGIKTMKTGENARFILQPIVAYREMGCPPRIPPNATIVFDVHLVSYFSQESFLIFNEDNRNPDRFNINLTRVKKLHFQGNEQFKTGNISKAVSKYNRALELLHVCGCNNNKEEIEMMKYLNKLYTNLSLCYLKLCAFNKVCRMGSEAMKYSERFSKHTTKLFFNWGKALRLLKNFTEAQNKLSKALKLEPNHENIKIEMQRLKKDREFNRNIELFSLGDNNVGDRLPPEFWEVFNTRLTEFINGDDDVLTVLLNKNNDDLELVKLKASSYNLHFQIVMKADNETNCVAIRKDAEK